MITWKVYVENGRDGWTPTATFTTPTQARRYAEHEYLMTEPGTPAGSLTWAPRPDGHHLYEDGESAGTRVTREGDDA